MQVGRPTTGHLHGILGALTRFSLPRLHAHSSVRATNALFAGQYEKCFRTWVTVHRSYAARRTAGVVDARIQADLLDPIIDNPGVLARAQVGRCVDPAREQVADDEPVSIPS